MKSRNHLFAILFSISILGCTDSVDRSIKEIVKVDAIGLRSQEEVQKLLGKPETTETIHDRSLGCESGCKKRTYLNNQVKVIYINGLADWIVVTPQNKILVHSLPHPLFLIGGGSKDDHLITFKTDSQIRWSLKEATKAPEIKLFLDKDTIRYYHVKLATD